MRNMLIASFGLLALGAASLAQANPGSRLTVVQTKYDRLAAYFDAKCDTDDLTPKCRRVRSRHDETWKANRKAQRPDQHSH